MLNLTEITYSDTVINSKLQFDKPMSSELTKPITMNESHKCKITVFKQDTFNIFVSDVCCGD